MLCTLPFAGFYYSAHDSEFDREIESLADHYASETPDNMPEWLMNLAWDSADFESARLEYSREYAESFMQWLSLDGTFESMSSPRFYNFETDRIFVTLTRNDVAKLWRGVDRELFTQRCRDRFTSRSGFTSHYSNDWRQWGRLSEWDHNQLGTLIGAYAETEQGAAWEQWSESELMESYLCKGGVSNALWNGEEGARFWKLFDYMIARANRPVRTLEQWHAARRAENRPFNETPLGSLM